MRFSLVIRYTVATASLIFSIYFGKEKGAPLKGSMTASLCC